MLLFIDLFLPLAGLRRRGLADEFGVDATFSGWRGIGFIVGLLTIVLLAWLIVRLASVDIPLPVSTAMTGALLGTLILIFTIIKLSRSSATRRRSGPGSVSGLVLIAVGAFMTVQEAGGVETLKSEASSYGSAITGWPGGAAATATSSGRRARRPPLRTGRRGVQQLHDQRKVRPDEADAASDARATSRRPSGSTRGPLTSHREAAARHHAPRLRPASPPQTPANLAFRTKASTLWRAPTGPRQPDADHTPKGISMAKFKSLSRGTQIVLVAGPLLFFSLFLTWQNVAVDYGRAGVADLPLDGWDAWGSCSDCSFSRL